MGRTRSVAFEVSILALLSALLVVQVYIPLVIPGGVAITTMHITVALGAIILGTRDGAILGLVWGSLSLFRAYTSPDGPLSILMFTNPVIAIVPRVMVGVVAGLLFSYFYKHTKIKHSLSLGMTGLFSALTNTTLVVLFTTLFFQNRSGAIFSAVHAGGQNTNLLMFLITLVGINALIEVIVGLLLVPAIGTPLLRFRREK
ncbi:ECF transporter S component [Lactobacillus sp. CC-MHH1034]|uniref:ECF transporter S component n=1 Tax=Agrilactobacillus fermenti TaxID=2586909 RepID=UPI001E412873|nr:ECF transporter S component [Agrilactobacillus fermenti]MCD2255132.1 ECF transporter S component [Agrilactobacillus fermenti]